jgi:hypothetical protein
MVIPCPGISCFTQVSVYLSFFGLEHIVTVTKGQESSVAVKSDLVASCHSLLFEFTGGHCGEYRNLSDRKRTVELEWKKLLKKTETDGNVKSSSNI